jgi:hypothetical protein
MLLAERYCPLEGFSLTKWCEENGLLGRVTSRAPKRCGDRMRPRGASLALPRGRPGAGGSPSCLSPQVLSLPVGSLRQDPAVIGEPEGRSWWKTSRELADPARVQPARMRGNPWSAGCLTSPRSGGQSAGGTGPGSRAYAMRGSLWRGAKNPTRASTCAGRGPWRARTSVGSKAL